MRIFDKQAPVLFHGSKYADRITIGKPEIIQHAGRDKLVRFYRDWYRPDLMAVVAVGDFDPKAIEAKIKSEFASLRGPKTPRERTKVTLPPHAETLVSIETDPEMPMTTVAIVSKLPHRPEASARDYRRSVSEQLFSSMLNARFDEIVRQTDPPVSFRVLDVQRHRENRRRVSSVSAGEGRRSRERLLGVARRSAEGPASRLHEGRARAGEGPASSPLPAGGQGAGQDRRSGVRFRDPSGISSKTKRCQVARPSSRWSSDSSRPSPSRSSTRSRSPWGKGAVMLAVTGPAKMQKPTAESLLAAEKRVAAEKIEPYVDAGPSVPLMKDPPKPGKVAKTNTIPEIGVTEWTLDNGVRVIVKPTAFENDEVRMSAFSPGGTSLVKDADYASAKYADEIVGQGGIGPFDATQLRKALAGKLVSARASIDELEEGVSGRAAPSDLETLFQMVYLGFTAPRRDEQAFAAWRSRLVENVKNRRLSPEGSFFEDMQILSTQNHLRRRPTTPEVAEKVDLDKALAIYKDRFADAGDFTFVFVGNIDLDRLKTLVETYLGSLPTKKRKENWRDVKVYWPSGVKTKTLQKGSEPKSLVTISFHGNEKWSRDSENDMRMLGEALRLRLRQILREDMGGVYGVQVGGAIRRRPRQEYSFGVSFGCSPDNVEKLKQAVFDEIKAVQQDGVAEDYIDKLKQARRRAHETDLQNNGYWVQELSRAYIYGDDPRLIPDITKMTDKVSSDRVRAAAKKYLSTKQYVLGVLEPEGAAKTP